MASRLDSTNPPDEAELDSAYEAARPHVQRLIERGLLKGDLDGDATDEIGAADAAAPEALKPLGVAAAQVVETTANAKGEPQAAPTPEHPVPVKQGQAAASEAAQEASAGGDAPLVEPSKTANDAPNAPEPPQATEPVAPIDDAPVFLSLVPQPAEVCAAKVEDADPASEITRLHGEIESSLNRSVERAIRIGELLLAEKQRLGHGKFLPWIKSSLPFTERTAQKYMQVYSGQADLKCESGSYLTDAYRLTAPKARPSQGPPGSRSPLKTPGPRTTRQRPNRGSSGRTTAASVQRRGPGRRRPRL